MPCTRHTCRRGVATDVVLQAPSERQVAVGGQSERGERCGAIGQEHGGDGTGVGGLAVDA